ncbi:nuclease-related domain-containing protein [Fredinandcohnia sp. QZ13]|uniref:nuclease-related domain-containing protein n=1 Tax=Fredinandcohnia sp. QZ13 TaxID=3073144 RepID=UPI00285336ED|nr:nuclease-related domain-containing protein [Fredinandcohnia sp. QZ13]MDR4888037.1 nuclease-related domain-containing protein [Fredinandcohnia sp. QZ13]
MVYKHRTKPQELVVFEILNKRTELSSKDKQYYVNLKKGYEGELLFDSLTEKLRCHCLILNDLLLEVNNTTFQIDTSIFIGEKIHFYEVKNFEGDYYYESTKLFKKPKHEVNNPLLQLNRSESLLSQLLRNHGCPLPIEASVIFINPTFTLYQAPLNLQAIFPTQLNNYLRALDTTPSKVNEKQKRIADLLVSLHITKSPYSKVPSYQYEQLRKGITCKVCDSFSIVIEGRKCKCEKCGHNELVADAVLRTVHEFTTLFPDQKITTNVVFEWCHGNPTKRKIQKILSNNFKSVGVRQWTYYE